MDTRRHLCGAIGCILLMLGGIGYSRGEVTVTIAALVRAGSLLAVAWLAWPQLSTAKRRLPQFVTFAVLLLAVVLVARPSLGKIAAAVVTLLVVGSFVYRWLSEVTRAN